MDDLTPQQILDELLRADQQFINAETNDADISPSLREKLFTEGQHPLAVVVACSDSRVIPEDIFMVGPGKLFTIRTAGNVIGEVERASIEYAIFHLGVRLVIIMGHSNCGAVGSAMKYTGGSGEAPDLVRLVEAISSGIAGWQDEADAIGKNIESARASLMQDEKIVRLIDEHSVLVAKLVYNTETGGLNQLP